MDSRKPTQMPLRIPASLHRDLKIAADQEGVSLNQYCLYLLAGRVKPYEMEQPKRVMKKDHLYWQGIAKASENPVASKNPLRRLAFLDDAYLLAKAMKGEHHQDPTEIELYKKWIALRKH